MVDSHTVDLSRRLLMLDSQADLPYLVGSSLCREPGSCCVEGTCLLALASPRLDTSYGEEVGRIDSLRILDLGSLGLERLDKLVAARS